MSMKRAKQPLARSCSVEGCLEPHDARGYCKRHYDRWRYSGSPLKPAKRACLAEGCEQLAYGKGYCPKHYARVRRHGDPYICWGKKEGELTRRAQQLGVSPSLVGKGLGVTRQRADQLLNPQKHSARKRAQYAVKCGLITTPKVCMVCERETSLLHRHHIDYHFPLAVIWACPICHAQLDAEERKRKCLPHITTIVSSQS